MPRQKKQKTFSLRIAFVIICIMLLISIVQMNIKLNALKVESDTLEKEISEVDLEIERLTSEFDKPITDEKMRGIAREMLGFYESDEIIYEVS